MRKPRCTHYMGRCDRLVCDKTATMVNTTSQYREMYAQELEALRLMRDLGEVSPALIAQREAELKRAIAAL